ncbi:YdcF family protein [Macrococcoides goetzii]|nr:YdcF family protein [Macrococcus goetzii]TDM40609.1 YdcF family protein [Macrococcus goetzii]
MNIHNITNTIFIEDKLKKSDVILIPGSSELGLAEKACQLYLHKYANMIVVSGGSNKKLSIEDNEASYLKRYMIKKGIPEHKIIVDTFASNTQEMQKTVK